MNDLKSLIRLKKWTLDERRRDLAELESLRDELAARAKALDSELERERTFVSASGTPQPGFPEYLKSTLKKRAQLARSIEQSNLQIAQIQDSIAVEFEALKQAEVALDKALERAARKAKKAEQDAMDEVAGATHRRRAAAR